MTSAQLPTTNPPASGKAPWWNRWAVPLVDSRRLLGVDVARAIALLGMIAVHLDHPAQPGTILSQWTASDLSWAHRYFGGTASALFCFLAGVSIAIASGCLANRPARPGAIGHLLARAAFIGYVGLLLTTDETRVAVILVYYAAMMLLLAPLIRMSVKVLLPLALAWLVVAPIASMYIRQLGPAKEYGQIGFAISEPLDHIAWNIFFTGYYPAFTWTAFMLLGLAIGKLDLRSPRIHLELAAIGFVGTAVGQFLYVTMSKSDIPTTVDPLTPYPQNYGHWWTGHYGVTPIGWDWLWLPIPHTASITDLVYNGSKVVLILAVALIVERLLGKRKWLLLPLSAAGAMTLTWYCLHVLWHRNDVLSVWAEQVSVILIISTLVAVLIRTRGPLEALSWAAARLGRQASVRMTALFARRPTL